MDPKHTWETRPIIFGRLWRRTTLMVQSEMGTATPGGAVIDRTPAIQDLQPQQLSCVNRLWVYAQQTKVGDILVARQLQQYEPQKMHLKQKCCARSRHIAERLY